MKAEAGITLSRDATMIALRLVEMVASGALPLGPGTACVGGPLDQAVERLMREMGREHKC